MHELSGTWPSAVPHTDLSFWLEAERDFAHGEIAHGVAAVRDGLARIRSSLGAEAWRTFARSPMLAPVREVLHEDPLSRRAWEKPRGYAADPDTFDLFYRAVSLPHGTSELGAAIYGFVSAGEASAATRERRDYLTALLDEVGGSRWSARVLSAACGHLREACRSRAVLGRRFGLFHAIDRDEGALEVVAGELSSSGVISIHGTLRDIVASTLEVSQYDLVYSCWVLECCRRLKAEALATALFRLVAPGGRLLLTNLSRTTPDAAYLEAVMDWWVVYREESELLAIAATLPSEEIARVSVFRGPGGHVVYLDVERKSAAT